MLFNNSLVEERYSAWQKKKVRTIIVNSRSRVASHRSIAGALAIAKPYERIELVGGEYFETLLINNPIEIVTADGEESCIISRGSCITITRDIEAYFEQVKFVSKSKSKQEPAVSILNGRSAFFRCSISSVLIGGWARPFIENCTIAESYNGYGVQISDSGGANIWQTTIHSHQIACVEIDTKGIVNMRENTIRQASNLGNGVVVKAVYSASDDSLSAEFLACRRVTVTKCRIYTSPEIYVPKDRELSSLETPPQPSSCVFISRGACPVFSYNELSQGNIGFTFDGAGSAVLEGNCIYKQKVSGILVIVDDMSSYVGESAKGLGITGGNRIDHCYVGVDVHCSHKAAMLAAMNQGALIPLELPSSRSSFSWLRSSEKENVKVSLKKKDESLLDKKVVVFGKSKQLKQLKSDLRALATMVCAGHIKHFISSTIADTRYGTGSSLNKLGELLEDTLNITLPPSNIADDAARFLDLRRTDGVEIRNTRFSGCGLCAIRFGSGSYGVVEDCSFLSCGATCIVVCSAAHPLIVGCKFEDAKGVAIFLDNFANPLIVGNEIVGNAENGVEIRNLSRGIVMGNAIVGSSTNGILVSGGSCSIITGNSIQTNNAAGIEVTDGSKPHILFNKFVGNKTAQILSSCSSSPFIACNSMLSGRGAGVHFTSCSSGTVIENTIVQSDRGVVIELDADPSIIFNQILNSVRYGVVVENNGLGTFLDNTIRESSACNVLVKEGGCPVLRKNFIMFGNAGGVVIMSEGSGSLDHNTISENYVANVILFDQYTQGTLRSNIISSSATGGGVLCARMAGGRFINNVIKKNKQFGICILGKAKPSIVMNTIEGEKYGVIVSDNGCGTIEQNDFNACSNAGILIQASGDPLVQGNRIFGSSGVGLLLATDGKGKIIENMFFENEAGLQCGAVAGNVVLDVDSSLISKDTEVSVARPQRSALVSRRVLLKRRENTVTAHNENPQVIIRGNKIYKNITCGMLIEAGTFSVVEENEIYSNDLYGILADSAYCGKQMRERRRPTLNVWKVPSSQPNGARVVIRKNSVFDNIKSNIAFVGFNSCEIALTGNEIYDSSVGIYAGNNSKIDVVEFNTIRNCVDGIFAEGGAVGHFTDNVIRDCSGNGVYVFDEAHPHFIRNTIEKCRISGVFADAGGRGVFKELAVHDCSVGVIAYTSTPVAADVEKEFIRRCVVTSSPSVEKCVIEHNYLHGVLLLTVPSGKPIRQRQWNGLLSCEPSNKRVSDSDKPMFPFFLGNTIRKNRHTGVCHELYTPDANPEESGSTSHCERPSKGRLSISKEIIAEHDVKTLRVSHSPAPEFNAHKVALGNSTILDDDRHFYERMLRQASFVDNEISFCSIGFVAGNNCHPFLLGNNIHHNNFLGILLRRGSKAACCRCKVVNNSWAGLYAAPHSYGSFAFGEIRSNNGLCRPENDASSIRCFAGFAFTEKADELPTCFRESSELEGEAYGSISSTLSSYGDIVASGIGLICKVISCPSSCFSLADTAFPSGFLEPGPSFSGEAPEHYDWGWAADGGIGVWITLGSMTDVSDTLIEGNRNIGVFFSFGVESHHKNMCKFILEDCEIPEIPGGETVNGHSVKTYEQNVQRLLFTTNDVCIHQSYLLTEAAPNGNASGDHKEESPKAASTPRDVEDEFLFSPLLLSRPPTIRSNTIVRNGCGAYIQLTQPLEAEPVAQVVEPVQPETPPPPPKVRKRGSVAGKSAGNATQSGLPAIRKNKVAAPRKQKNTEEEPVSACTPEPKSIWADILPPHMLSEVVIPAYAVSVQENAIYDNLNFGILCHHILELHCGDFIARRSEIGVAAETYNVVCVRITLKNQTALPDLLFRLRQHERMARHAYIGKNDVHSNAKSQIQVASRYVAITGDKQRTLLQIDTLRRPFASMCSSCALLRIPVFASLTAVTTRGCFHIDQNVVHNSMKGVHILGILGERSTSICRNVFTDIKEASIFIEGHLASATIGDGNMFERNSASITVSMPEDECTEEERQWQLAMGIVTRIYGNKFVFPNKTSIVIKGSGSVSPVVGGNRFTDHPFGRVVIFCDSASGAVIKGNVFQENYIPIIITNSVGEHGSVKRVSVEGNLFTRNYIGLLVCDRAVPHITHNIFEGNYRSGIEIIGKGTSPTVQHCLFVPDKSGISSSSDLGKFSYPEKGLVYVENVPQFSVILQPENVVTQGDVDTILSVGILVQQESSGLIESCFFKGNQIGVDVVATNPVRLRDISTTALSDTACASFRRCLFFQQSIAGVWARGPDSGVQSHMKASARRPRFDASDEGVIFEHCFFIGNVNNTEDRGDVVAVGNASVMFKNSMFTGCIHGGRNSSVLFEENIMSRCRGSNKTVETSVFMHKGTRIELFNNVILNYKVSVVTQPGAWGRIEKNWIINASRCVISAPFCNTLFSANRMLTAKECGIFAYGGIFVGNEVTQCPTGVVVRNPVEYAGYSLIPNTSKGSHNLLLSENRIHTCDICGIFVAGVGRIESNVVYNCKNNMTISCPTKSEQGEKIPQISGNAIFDGVVGMLIMSRGDAIIEGNNIFDNDTYAVMSKKGAQGKLTSNNISSPLKDGTLAIDEGSGTKLVSNTIRNQFSPVYNKTLAPQRAVERLQMEDTLKNELQEQGKRASAFARACTEVEKEMRLTFNSLKDSCNVEGYGVSVGMILSNCIQRSLLDNDEVDLRGIDIPALDGPEEPKQGDQDPSNPHDSKEVLPAITGFGPSSPRSGCSYEVYIHIINAGDAEQEIDQIAEDVNSVFTTLSLALQIPLPTSVTSRCSDLSIGPPNEQPKMLVVVLPNTKDNACLEVHEKALRNIMQRRHPTPEGGVREQNGICVVPLVSEFFQDHVDSLRTSGGLHPAVQLEDLLSSSNPIYFTSAVSECLEELQQRAESWFLGATGALSKSQSGSGGSNGDVSTGPSAQCLHHLQPGPPEPPVGLSSAPAAEKEAGEQCPVVPTRDKMLHYMSFDLLRKKYVTSTGTRMPENVK